MSTKLTDNDIDGLLDQLDSAHESTPSGADAKDDDEGLSFTHREEKEKKKKKKREKRHDLEMGPVGGSAAYESAGSSTYQSGAAHGQYSGGSGYSGAAGGQFNANSTPLPRREFSMCSSGNQDLVINMCLLLAFCAFEAVFAMISGSLLLMLDFYRRLGGVFTMVYSLEVLQASCESEVVDGRTVSLHSLPEINATTDPRQRLEKVDAAALERRGGERRRYYIASLMVGVYLLTVSFVQAMESIVSMYGVVPAVVSKSGWILMIGCLCGVLDLVHVRYGVKVHLGLSDDEDAPLWKKILMASYGSLFVCLDAAMVMMIGGGYVDPLLVLVFAATVAYCSTDTVMKMAAALQYKAWEERI